tara:strand:+ start:2488 stop:2691 length:204 start_codon:yes stop_codon:yes gene_type:complete
MNTKLTKAQCAQLQEQLETVQVALRHIKTSDRESETLRTEGLCWLAEAQKTLQGNISHWRNPDILTR